MQQIVILLVINCSTTCFGCLYAHHQDVRLLFTASVVAVSQATSSTQCTQLTTRLSSITTATTGQKTIGSETQSDLLMMGVKTPETCWGTVTICCNLVSLLLLSLSLSPTALQPGVGLGLLQEFLPSFPV
jgi:hypothetical protein